VDYDGTAYDFGKPFRHLAMGTALLALILFARRLEIASLARVGLQRREGWLRQFGAGALIGAVSLAIVIAVAFICGARVVNPRFHFSCLLGALPLLALQALVIGLWEETFFRGFILQSFLRDMRALAAILVTSFVFASLHFIDVPVILPTHFDPLAGFRALAIFKGLIARPVAMLPELFGLALIGIALSCAYVWTRSLYLPIGLHAGWVFVWKFTDVCFKRNRAVARWFFGGGIPVTGVLGILCLLAVVLLLYVLWGRSIRNPQSAIRN
jgi:membrane protease YdiL (CAAX protease family)